VTKSGDLQQNIKMNIICVVYEEFKDCKTGILVCQPHAEKYQKQNNCCVSQGWNFNNTALSYFTIEKAL
jgi:hypothetical protein